jgi:hypothetical protein
MSALNVRYWPKADIPSCTGSSFCVPNQFYNPQGPAKRTVTGKKDERCASTRCPTILFRGAPFIRTLVTKKITGKLYQNVPSIPRVAAGCIGILILIFDGRRERGLMRW